MVRHISLLSRLLFQHLESGWYLCGRIAGWAGASRARWLETLPPSSLR